MSGPAEQNWIQALHWSLLEADGITADIPSFCSFLVTTGIQKVTDFKPKNLAAYTSDRLGHDTSSGILLFSWITNVFSQHRNSTHNAAWWASSLPQRLPAQSIFSAHTTSSGAILATSAWCCAKASCRTPKGNSERLLLPRTPRPPQPQPWAQCLLHCLTTSHTQKKHTVPTAHGKTQT